MNRKQRRDKAKRHQAHKRDVYAQIQHAAARRAAEDTLDIVREEIKGDFSRRMVLSMAYALHEEFGFGEKRLARAFKKFAEVNNDVADGWLTHDDMAQVLKEECRFEY